MVRGNPADATHVRREVVHLLYVPHGRFAVLETPQVRAIVELRRYAGRKLGRFEVYRADVMAARYEVADEVMANEASATRDEDI